MKGMVPRVALALALLVAGCDSEAAAPTPLVAAPSLEPMHGGALLVLGVHRVELVAHRSGEVFGYLTRVDGRPVASPAQALMTIAPTVDDGPSRPVLLRWNPARVRYEVRLREEPVEGPAEVSLMSGATVERGTLDPLPVAEALTNGGVAYSEDEAFDDEDDDDEADEAEVEGERGQGGRSRGGLRARARRLLGL